MNGIEQYDLCRDEIEMLKEHKRDLETKPMTDSTILDAVKRLREAAPAAQSVHVWIKDRLADDKWLVKAGIEYVAHVSWSSNEPGIFEQSDNLEDAILLAIARALAYPSDRKTVCEQKIESLRAELAKLEAEQKTNNERVKQYE